MGGASARDAATVWCFTQKLPAVNAGISVLVSVLVMVCCTDDGVVKCSGEWGGDGGVFDDGVVK